MNIFPEVDKLSIINEASGLETQTHAHGQYQATSRVSIKDPSESSRRAGLSTARLPAFSAPALPGFVPAGWSERV
jgi:hypothetical protein